jgi:hypothetical protein
MRSVPISAFLMFRGLIRSRIALHLEVLALHHQLQVLQRSQPHRLALGKVDRIANPQHFEFVMHRAIRSRLLIVFELQTFAAGCPFSAA